MAYESIRDTFIGIVLISILLGGVARAVAAEGAFAAESAGVAELESAGDRVWEDNRGIEVDEVAVACGGALARSDSVAGVAGRAGGVLLDDVGSVFGEGFIAQNAVAVVAAVAEGVGTGALGGRRISIKASDQEGGVA